MEREEEKEERKERKEGRKNELSSSFHPQALNSCSQMDYPEALFEAYLSFEREEGSLEEVMEATEFVEKQRKLMKERKAKKAEKEAKESAKKGNMPGGPAGKFGGKNKRPHDGEAAADKQNGVPIKKKKDNAGGSISVASSPTVTNDGFKVPQLPKMPAAGKAAKPVAKTDSKTTNAAANPTPTTPASAAPAVDEALEKRDRTIFVSNMNYHASEEDLKDAFKFCGPISSIRLATDTKTGKPRGWSAVMKEK